MRSKTQSPAINLKLIICCLFFLFRSFITLFRSNFSAPFLSSISCIVTSSSSPDSFAEEIKPNPSTISCPKTESSSSLAPQCTKISPSLANALVHYAIMNITPQQTFCEISVSMRVLDKKLPCNFLVFGLGHDSLMWTALNHGGRTVFLEEDRSWIDHVKSKLPNLEAYHVEYDTKVTQAEELMEKGSKDEECKVVGDPRFSKCKLAFEGFPNEVYDMEWDIIMVDAPTCWHEEAPGRMSAIYTAGLMARNRESGDTDLLVHDVDREIEDTFSKEFLCEGYMREQEGRIRHFTIPSHWARLGTTFCPESIYPLPY